jgi:hypothetical protein
MTGENERVNLQVAAQKKSEEGQLILTFMSCFGAQDRKRVILAFLNALVKNQFTVLEDPSSSYGMTIVAAESTTAVKQPKIPAPETLKQETATVNNSLVCDAKQESHYKEVKAVKHQDLDVLEKLETALESILQLMAVSISVYKVAVTANNNILEHPTKSTQEVKFGNMPTPTSLVLLSSEIVMQFLQDRVEDEKAVKMINQVSECMKYISEYSAHETTITSELELQED